MVPGHFLLTRKQCRLLGHQHELFHDGRGLLLGWRSRLLLLLLRLRRLLWLLVGTIAWSAGGHVVGAGDSGIGEAEALARRRWEGRRG